MSAPVGASPNAGAGQSAGYRGQWWAQSGGSGFKGIDFIVRAILAEQARVALVKVLTVTGGGVGVPAMLSVQPMVSQTDGWGNLTPHGPISNIPAFRYQGGAGAVIVDPVAGDIGLAVFADRDISTVKATRAVAGPGSARQAAWSDGLYLGGFLGLPPTNYVKITQDRIDIVSTGTISLSGTRIILNGVVWDTHVHDQGADSHGDAEVPTDGPVNP